MIGLNFFAKNNPRHLRCKAVGLASYQVDLWLGRISDILSYFTQVEVLDTLSKSEILQYETFLNKAAAAEFLATRLMIRYLLSLHITTLQPNEIIFSKNNFGKLQVAQSLNHSGITFNISHSNDFIFCGIAKNVDIGVDIELQQIEVETLTQSEDVFTSAEIAAFDLLKSEQKSELFYRTWTLKEAFVKALGKGFGFPLNSISFEMPIDCDGLKQNNIQICASQHPIESASWQFRSFKLEIRDHDKFFDEEIKTVYLSVAIQVSREIGVEFTSQST